MTQTRAPRLLVVDPGASWSTADVCAGLCYGLTSHGVDVRLYKLAARIDNAGAYLHSTWRRMKKLAAQQAATTGTPAPALERPTKDEIFYQAGIFALEAALRQSVDAVLIVSAMFFHPNVIHLMKRAGLKVFILFTESPYDLEKELDRARLVDGVWTHERSVVDAFTAVNPCTGYLRHGWHPERHLPGPQPGDDQVPAHDVVFIGSAFRERVEWFEAIDWTGIDLGLYGTWDELPRRSPLRAFVKGAQVDNRVAAALYRRAKVSLNLYRQSIGWGKDAPRIAHADSLNPRAYELAACGAFHLSDDRAEVREVFGDLVPTFRTPTEAAALMRVWLADDARRRRIAEQLPACVAESSWRQRAATVIGDLEGLLGWQHSPVRRDREPVATGVAGG